MNQPNKFIISGGGTGGHIFPAIAIANALKAKVENAQILFIGAEGRMEMEKVPAAGYPIIGLPIRGFDRKNMLRNVKTLYLLAKSMYRARKIVKDFAPNAVIGVGGYASGPTLKVASQLNIPVIVQEQNSFAGVTNKLLSDKAACFCVAYEGMERFFPKEKIILTGNPIRQDLQLDPNKKEDAYRFFNLDPAKKTLLVIGGSLGARTLNQSLLKHLDLLVQSDIQVIWQAGKIYIESLRALATPHLNKNIILTDFVARMDYAYAIANLVISRAGASSISELCLLGKPSILVPSPNVAEDHQTHNALALVNKDAAIMIKDVEAKEALIPEALKLIKNHLRLEQLATNSMNLAQKDSAARIADEILKRAK
ncbi:MAG: UDP-N-acetylglucosamine--N-acetylmuramyl-(pentapeptide) pyrophosphoryl-undecaprenol [Bacteroidetes bacterium]|jgi:UDP-N-acetylglucosamine--N-acetylmuramyl-(pentapeptide) pyrophosphoryl-undecaprenol N-acetylglucosamine transferase|nr:UDP-N-acetylglucosamine--N-acetylmuramyl-(pentapeptide) pyrophosphoryl-undecaprenol [Bacteroidota bacterium]